MPVGEKPGKSGPKKEPTHNLNQFQNWDLGRTRDEVTKGKEEKDHRLRVRAYFDPGKDPAKPIS